MWGATDGLASSGLGERHAGLEAADHGDDVSPVAGRAVEVERRDGIDLGAGGEYGAEVEGAGSTPMTVVWRPFMSNALPTMSGSPANWRFHHG